MNPIKQRLKQSKPLIGTLLTLGLPAIAEMISACGFDWLWIDMEHGPLSLEQVQQLMQAKSEDCAAFVRIPINDDVYIKRVLDLGADGIIVPQVNTPEEARRAVAASKYPPVGTRSVGIARAQRFGMDFATYVQEANEKLLVILQIEHVEAVKNIEAILAVPGVDAIIIGPYDLSGSFGKLGQIHDSQVQQAIETVYNACKQHGMPIGIFALQPEQGRVYIKQEYNLVALGIDVHYLWSAAKAGFESLSAAPHMVSTNS
jgi:2-dehydro-3-deoxyglucarate aldolase/4-hydroxy-2-oxoheptanedioate aldolase